MINFTAQDLINKNRILSNIKKYLKVNFGKLSFKKFMEINLYHKKYGYYVVDRDYSLDFITAPIYSKIFSETFAKIFANVISFCKKDMIIVEIGAGNGLFAKYCLSKLDNIGVEIKYYYIIEKNINTIKIQKNNLKKNIMFNKIKWFKNIPKIKETAMIFANEVLDSMPVDIFYYKYLNDTFYRVMVDIINNKFIWKYCKKINNSTLKLLYSLPISKYKIDYLFELNLDLLKWIKEIKSNIIQGILFICDYGYHQDLLYNKDRNMGTLLCYCKHKIYENPFINVGIQDITSHVNFTLLAKTAEKCNFNVAGFFTQGSFLINNGIIESYKDNLLLYNNFEKIKLSVKFKNLTLGTMLSDQFKVMILTYNYLYQYDHLYFKDLRYLL